jgi:MFS family permease
MLGVPALRVLVDVLIFRQVPDEQRGRVIAAVITLFGLGGPIGVGAAGLLLQYFPARTAMAVLAGTLALGVAYSLTRRALRTVDWPADGPR